MNWHSHLRPVPCLTTAQTEPREAAAVHPVEDHLGDRELPARILAPGLEVERLGQALPGGTAGHGGQGREPFLVVADPQRPREGPRRVGGGDTRQHRTLERRRRLARIAADPAVAPRLHRAHRRAAGEEGRDQGHDNAQTRTYWNPSQLRTRTAAPSQGCHRRGNLKPGASSGVYRRLTKRQANPTRWAGSCRPEAVPRARIPPVGRPERLDAARRVLHRDLRRREARERHAVGAARDVVEARLPAEGDRLCVAAVLAADRQRDARPRRAPALRG